MMNVSSACVEAGRRRQDPLRRLMPTPLAANLSLMARTIRLETNSPAILEPTRDLLHRYSNASHGPQEFLWRIVSESVAHAGPPWPEVSAFSCEDLRFASFGQHGFLAVDLAAREAVGWLPEGLAADPAGFVSPFLNTLFVLTAGALRLTPLSAACVTVGRKGVVVLGKPNNGKTTSSYLTARLGLEFYSDGAVFLDLDDGRLRLWGDFSPASFRPETARFLPSLFSVGREFRYRDMTFLYVDGGTSIPFNGYPIVPVACVFLERGVQGTPRLTPLDRVRFSQELEDNLPFRDDERFENQTSAALSALSHVPAYHLTYGPDPGVAATFLRNILMIHKTLEVGL